MAATASLCGVGQLSCPKTVAGEAILHSSFASKVARMCPGKTALDRFAAQQGAPLDEGLANLVPWNLEKHPTGSDNNFFNGKRVNNSKIQDTRYT